MPQKHKATVPDSALAMEMNALEEQAENAKARKLHWKPLMMILLLLFLQKQSLAFAVYLFGIGTLHTGPGLKKKNTCDNALTMTSPVHW
jgi:hypothetical protein